ncbi:2',3'-cyclic-nucleotide 2'-phosphodiesterase / 3'-nucleotidase [Roseovarius litoreus]|uniref:2',3'-cyclic-nucleotide 2'-phosphodiesterase / 3'-nucleotidase n=1 Tax=Roseovarius litoreus TaxID=1155722 RepID=A0A1M6ZW36_9RHOB|nr:bifunctional 2',3'-cyclic-nucleotide 2'-phosphodiesterase/3'-nucleotidase [Roseovarius litoreus]SHL34717.1 2',3'-cyclic-nucleotide 2'-phosphodiesterase / 3'-nucleotidase [Roseovarius litoreus]
MKNHSSSTPFRTTGSSATLRLRLLETTDIHGHIAPFDYLDHRNQRHGGLARVATLIRAARAEARNCLLFDNGDFLQGSALSDLLHDPVGWHGPHPVIAAMNALDYDGAALGNHEFDFGLDFLCDALSQARFPVVCANLHPMGTTRLPATPTLLLERRLEDEAGQLRDLRIGVIGVVVPQVAKWNRDHLEGRVAAAGIAETARLQAPALRAAGADLVVMLAHTGIDAAADHPGLENAALPLASVSGVDVVLAGHSHRVFPGPDHDGLPGVDTALGTLHGIPAVMAGFAGSHLGIVDLDLRQDARGWRITHHHCEARPVQHAPGTPPTPPDPAILRVVGRAHHRTVSAMRKPLNTTRTPLHSYLALIRDDPVTALVNAAQTAAIARALLGTRAEGLPVLSATAPFRTGGRAGPYHYIDITPGPFRMGDAVNLYPFPNTLTCARITGARLRDWLERAASCFHQIRPGLADQPLLDPRFPGHAFDTVSGVTYRIDPGQPARFGPDGTLIDAEAWRIRDLQIFGRAVRDTDLFVLATNTYRASGSGPYPMLTDHDILDAPALQVRDALVNHVRRGPPIDARRGTGWALRPVCGASVLVDTGPGLRRHPWDIRALGAEELGCDAKGFLRLRLPLGADAPLANPPQDP